MAMGWTIRGSYPGGGEIFRTCPDGPWYPPCAMGTVSFPGVKSGWGVTLTPHPLLMPWSRKSRAVPLLPLWAVGPACTEPQCLYKCALYLTLLHISSFCLCACLCMKKCCCDDGQRLSSKADWRSGDRLHVAVGVAGDWAGLCACRMCLMGRWHSEQSNIS